MTYQILICLTVRYILKACVSNPTWTQNACPHSDICPTEKMITLQSEYGQAFWGFSDFFTLNTLIELVLILPVDELSFLKSFLVSFWTVSLFTSAAVPGPQFYSLLAFFINMFYSLSPRGIFSTHTWNCTKILRIMCLKVVREARIKHNTCNYFFTYG